MNIIHDIQQALAACIAQTLAINVSDTGTLTLNTNEAKQAFGDLSSNAALILAKQTNQAPRALAELIVASFSHEHIQKIEIAGPGFLNLYLTNTGLATLAFQLADQKENFFKPIASHKKESINIEFVSANPTGPLHFGHGRGGIIGDVLGNILTFLGHYVTKEFYINDAGRQIEKLGASFKARYMQAVGIDAQVPEDGYQGDYLADLAQTCIQEHGAKLLDQPDEFFADYAKTNLLALLKKTLIDYGITFDVWFSEKTLHDSGAIEKALVQLNQHGYLYEQDDATWFRATQFGDDKDRVVCRTNGELTYVAADIAYLKNKCDRGFSRLFMTLGQDHHGYVARLHAIQEALELNGHPLDVILYQLVKIKADGESVRMSKRAGNIVTLRDVIDTVGTDVARFFYLNRKADAQLEFDLDLALKKTEENPVYYIQYAFVRTKSILQKAAELSEFATITAADTQYVSHEESLLIKKITSLSELLLSIEANHQTHALAYYSHELAQTFSKYYSKHRVIDATNVNQSRGRLAVVNLVHTTLELCLDLMGISKPERM